MWTNKDGTKHEGNVWLKRLGLFIIIVACFSDYFKSNLQLFNIIFFGLIALALFSIIFKNLWGFIKDIFR